jgi:hypothetical protein
VHLYSVPQDMVSGFQYPCGDSAFLCPHKVDLCRMLDMYFGEFPF